jgi:hypothetical protein
MTARAEDLILVSVDDHICEPADMFDAHVASSGTTAMSEAGTWA